MTAIAALIIFVGASADYALLVGSERICAKSSETCEAARAAIAAGRWPITAPDTPTRCEPAPNCFARDSNTIKGYNR